MKIEAPKNENYAATVVRIKSTHALEGCDNVVGTPIFGFQAIVGKDTEPGTPGIVLPAECQVSEEFARENNLFRHANLNNDPGAKGYLEDNRRVKAMKFRGHRSDCLFMPLSSLKFTGINYGEVHEGDTFDEINGHEICRKYLRKQPGVPRVEKNKSKKFSRVEKQFLPENYDTENYWRNARAVNGNRRIVVTQKLHGTSIRIGNTVVKRQIGIVERLAKALGAKVAEHEYDYVFGSRRVIKDANNPNQQHFYETDIWTEEGKKYEGVLPQGFILYAELIGWTAEGAPIQKNYTYKVPPGTCDLYVYRVAFVNPQGSIVDLSWEQVKEFCRDRDLKTVPELWSGIHSDFTAYDWIDKRLKDSGYANAVPLDDNKDLVDEGVCIRVDGMAPYILKAKSPIFLQHETKMLDEEAVDLEEEGSDGDN